MNKIISRIAGQPNHRFKPGASAKQIEEFQKRTRIILPDAYQDWLSFSDGGEIFVPGVELLGVAEAQFPKLIVRRGDGAEAPVGFVVIGRTASGDAVCFEAGKDRIVQFDHETGDEFLSFDNFFDYLEKAGEMYGDEP